MNQLFSIIPQTGDTFSFAPIIAVAVVALVGLVVAIVIAKKKK